MLHIYIYIYVFFIYIYVFIFIYIYICLFKYAHTPTDSIFSMFLGHSSNRPWRIWRSQVPTDSRGARVRCASAVGRCNWRKGRTGRLLRRCICRGNSGFSWKPKAVPWMMLIFLEMFHLVSWSIKKSGGFPYLFWALGIFFQNWSLGPGPANGQVPTTIRTANSCWVCCKVMATLSPRPGRKQMPCWWTPAQWRVPAKIRPWHLADSGDD